MKLRRYICQLGILVVAVSLLTGCATPALWAKKPHHPAANPELSLALAPDRQDVLVRYQEQCGNSKHVRTRAYWLFAYNSRSAKHPKPRFTDPVLYDRLSPVPVFDAPAASIPPKGYAAFVADDMHSFHLWRDGTEIGTFNLPAYQGAPRATAWRLGLTPIAVAADTALVAAVCMASSSGGAL